MAAVILLVGFIGMIEAVVIGAGMMDNARRQTLAAQILNHETEQLRLLSWTAINSLPTTSTTLGAAYSASTPYVVGDTVTHGGAWYRCIQAGTGQTPSGSSSYWRTDTPPYANTLSTAGVALGATFTLTRTAANITTDALGNTNMREATFTITWVVNTSRRDSLGNLLTFTYSRTMSAFYGKYGLNLSHQRS